MHSSPKVIQEIPFYSRELLPRLHYTVASGVTGLNYLDDLIAPWELKLTTTDKDTSLVCGVSLALPNGSGHFSVVTFFLFVEN